MNDIDLTVIKKLLPKGNDVTSLNENQRTALYEELCNAAGLNYLFRPFDFITQKGKTFIYANKNAAEQLSRMHQISIKISSADVLLDICKVVAHVEIPVGDGHFRINEATGCVSIAGLQGEALANAFMKAETKAKRRAILSACGLGLLDETEVESMGKLNSVDNINKNDGKYPNKMELIDNVKYLLMEMGVSQEAEDEWLAKNNVKFIEHLPIDELKKGIKNLEAKKAKLTNQG